MPIWEADKLLLFVLFVVPGFITLKTYELFYPSQGNDSSKRVVDAVSYSCIVWAIAFVPIVSISKLGMWESHKYLSYFFVFFVLFVVPVLLAFSWRVLRNSSFIQSKAPHPVPKPWDFVFAKRKEYFLKVVLKNGKVVGGKYFHGSFASSYPEHEQLYLIESWIINDRGGFVRPKVDSAGILIMQDEISYIEFRKWRVEND